MQPRLFLYAFLLFSCGGRIGMQDNDPEPLNDAEPPPAPTAVPEDASIDAHDAGTNDANADAFNALGRCYTLSEWSTCVYSCMDVGGHCPFASPNVVCCTK